MAKTYKYIGGKTDIDGDNINIDVAINWLNKVKAKGANTIVFYADIVRGIDVSAYIETNND